MSNRLWIISQDGNHIVEIEEEVFMWHDVLNRETVNICTSNRILGKYRNEMCAIDVLDEIASWIAKNQNAVSFPKTIFSMPQDYEVRKDEL